MVTDPVASIVGKQGEKDAGACCLSPFYAV